MNNQLKQFSNKYPITKTLRFELIPQGKTLDFIKKKGFLKNDEKRAESYQKMKKTIDKFHQDFIEKAMSNLKLPQLKEFEDLYNKPAEEKKTDKYKKIFSKAQENLRKEVAKAFKADEVKHIFSKIDKKELITKLLEEWIKENHNKEIYFDENFKKFTTYFTGFHQNRQNMYTDKEQSTAIAYRLVHENLPKFLDNIKIFQKLKIISEFDVKLDSLYSDIEEYLNINRIEDAFTLDYFNEVLAQTDIDVYNLIIGGKTDKDADIKTKGLNEYINEYNQKQKTKKNRIPKLKMLYKQILSDRNNISFLPDAFEDDEDSTASQKVLDAVNHYYHSNLLDYLPSDKTDSINILKNMRDLIAGISDFDIAKIYLKNDNNLTTISQKIFGNYNIFKDALNYQYTNNIDPNFNETYEKANENKRDKLDKEKSNYIRQSHFSIEELQKALNLYVDSLDESHEVKKAHTKNCIANYFKDYFLAEVKKDSNKKFDFVSNIEAKLSTIKGLLNTPYNDEENLHQKKKKIDDIKLFLDSIFEYLHFIKPLALPEDFTLEKDEHFYTSFEEMYEQMRLLIPLYNKVRNYATQKPYSTEKFKLNFENSSFLSGWASDYTTKGGLIIKKEGDFYLCIVDKKLKKKDIEFLKANSQENKAYRVVYDFQKPDNKNVPRIFIRSKGDNYAPAVLKHNLPVESIIDIYDNGFYKTEYKKINPEKFKKSLIQLIDYFKLGFSRHDSYRHYNFEWKKSDEYDNIASFYQDVINSCYQLKEELINYNHLLQLIEEEKLYLFQIYNKDFSKFSKGKPNLHTMYWKALFDEDNLKDVIYKLNGEAEIFYRKKSIQPKRQVVHKRNQAIKNKNPNNDKKESEFEYDIVKDRRYTVDKFQFHVPITLNFKANGGDYINNDVLDYLKDNPDVKIIGLDRGERHLIYLTLIDQQGNIIEQETLNTIINKKHNLTTSYHQLLDEKEKERDQARKNWGTVENIKELKEGYVSQVVHKIANMMVEHNAIVVMEDLNTGFKRGRFKVEKQVYQKLENMLIDKLNYLVLKDRKPNDTAGIYNALQLTNKFESFQKMGKQSGFLFYVPAWNTSKIDPTTGFVNLFHTKYESVQKAQDFFSKFKSIHFNKEKNYFEFDFDYNDFTTRAEGTRSKWTVCTYGDRIKTFRNPDKLNQWDNKEIRLTEAFEDFFGKNNITYGDGQNFKEQIIAQSNKSFFSELIYLFRLILQMRNSITNSDVDYLISPVLNKTGSFYDSRQADSTLPQDADANGAFHIAKKGLQWLQEIQDFDGGKWKDLKLNKTNKGWLKFTQKNTF